MSAMYRYCFVKNYLLKVAIWITIILIASTLLCSCSDTKSLTTTRPTNNDFTLSGSLLESISCPSVNYCKALDSSGRVFTYSNGKWSKSIQIRNNYQKFFYSISCPDRTFCLAVGGRYLPQNKHGYFAKYSNGEWSSFSDKLGSSSPLGSVSCVSSSFCVAANGGGEALFYEGNKWTQAIAVVKQTVVQAFQSQYGSLTSISCASKDFCIAVGNNGYEYTFRNGIWSAGLRIDKTSLEYGSLNTISCPTNKFCVAGDFNGFVFTYLNGLWTSGIQIVKNQNHTLSINSVSCPKNNFCIAVDNSGYAYIYSHGVWSEPNHIDKYGGLSSISCPVVQNCKAIDDVFSYVFSFDNGKWSKLIKLENGNY